MYPVFSRSLDTRKLEEWILMDQGDDEDNTGFLREECRNETLSSASVDIFLDRFFYVFYLYFKSELSHFRLRLRTIPTP